MQVIEKKQFDEERALFLAEAEFLFLEEDLLPDLERVAREGAALLLSFGSEFARLPADGCSSNCEKKLLMSSEPLFLLNLSVKTCSSCLCILQ